MLYCDYDCPEPISTWELNRVFHILKIRPEWIRYDRTEHGWHLIVKMDRALPDAAIVALQAILGSDPRRETLNLMRALSEPTGFAACRWNVLFREKLK